MRSKIAKRILDETPQKVKDGVNKYADNLIKNRMIGKRELTGRWYLKKSFFRGYEVMVEVISFKWDDSTYGNGGGSLEETVSFKTASHEDLLELNLLGINKL